MHNKGRSPPVLCCLVSDIVSHGSKEGMLQSHLDIEGLKLWSCHRSAGAVEGGVGRAIEECSPGVDRRPHCRHEAVPNAQVGALPSPIQLLKDILHHLLFQSCLHTDEKERCMILLTGGGCPAQL